MENILNSLLKFIKGVSKIVWISIAAVIAIVIAFVSIIGYLNKDNRINIESDNNIDITPQQVKSIEMIGEWEFLSIADEELVDTVKRNIFGDDRLVRIYYGTLRLGVNLNKTKPNWIYKDGDSISVILPQIELLDDDFIDEARTKSFFESGKWNNNVREDLYKRAHQKMKSRCMIRKNIENAEENARQQFQQLMNSMGFDKVSIRFDK